ncbi:hypothetical protein Skr01_62740 [Sphaerisporangium krabiense]|nr:hypothetical protein Skr01_62740 [Sphaerisporangium krabiense]
MGGPQRALMRAALRTCAADVCTAGASRADLGRPSRAYASRAAGASSPCPGAVTGVPRQREKRHLTIQQ